MAIEFELEMSFPVAPEKVFAAITDVNAFDQWMPGLKHAEVLSEGEYGEGTVFQETRRMFFQDATERFRVTVHEPPELLELTVDGSEGSSRSGLYTFFYHFEPEPGGGTSMSMHGTISGMNRVMELIGRIMARFMVRSIRKDYRALAKHLTPPEESE